MNEPEHVPELVTLHVWRIPRAAVGRALVRMARDPRRLRALPGVRFGKLLGTGTGTGFGPGDADLTRWAALTVWDSPAAATRFAESSVGRAWSRIAVAGAALSGVAIIGFGYIAHRYLTDLVPFFVLGGLVGLHAVAARLLDPRDGDGPRTAPRWLGAAVLVALVAGSLWTAWINTALALQYGKEIAPGLDESTRAAWIRTQSTLGGGFDPVRVGTDEELPAPRRVGELVVVGDCDGLYRSNGTGWFLVELGGDAGGVRLELTRDGVLGGPVVLAGTPDGSGAERTRLVLEPLGGDEVRLVVVHDDQGQATRSLVGPTSTLADGASTTLDVMADRHTGKVVVEQQDPDRELLRVELPVAPPPLDAVGDDVVAVTSAPLATPTCDELLAEGDD